MGGSPLGGVESQRSGRTAQNSTHTTPTPPKYDISQLCLELDQRLHLPDCDAPLMTQCKRPVAIIIAHRVSPVTSSNSGRVREERGRVLVVAVARSPREPATLGDPRVQRLFILLHKFWRAEA
jgi:hypothetical protein